MKNKINDIDNLFSEKLKNFSEKPSDNIWEDIKEELIFDVRRRRINRIKWIAASVIILFTFSMIFLFVPDNNIDKKISENNIEKSILKDSLILNKYNTNKKSDKPKNIKKLQVSKKEFAVAKKITPSDKKNINKKLIANSKNSNTKIQLRISNIENLPKQIVAVNLLNNSNLIQIQQINKRSEYVIYDFISEDIMINKPEIIRWSVVGDFTSGYSYRNIELNDVSYSTVALKQEFNENEKGLYAFSYGLKIRYNTKSNFSFLSGVNFSSLGQKNNEIVSYKSPDNSINIPTSIGNIKISNSKMSIINSSKVDTDTLIDGTNFKYLSDLGLTQKLKYIEIPFEVKYTVIDKSFKFNIIGGISTGVLINNNTYLEKDNESIELDGAGGLKSFIYNGVVGLGLEYNIYNNMSLVLEPSFKYYLSSINKKTIIKYYPYIFNCSFGICYSFK
ncbi:MAG: hypothetical protein J7J86_05060 [Bacteroidales bacterium]|nr:hypothetical protein [Bacteroidales bacterium]